MSTFKTTLKAETDRIKKLLPKDATVEKVTFDPATNEIAMQWHHQFLQTPFTYPVEFSEALLEAKRLPDGVVQRERPTYPAPVTLPAAPATAEAPEVKKPKNPKPPKAVK